jgi:choline kinase
MKAVILAAGSSTRLRPHTNYTPKCLLTVAGVPMLRRSIDNLLAAGDDAGHGDARHGKIDELVLVTGYRRHQIHSAVKSWYPELRTHFIVNDNYASTNNAYSLLLARELLAGEEFLLLDSDIVFDVEVVEALLRQAPDSLALRPCDQLGAEEVKVALVPGSQRIREISKEVDLTVAAGESIGIERFAANTSHLLFDVLAERVLEQGRVNEFYEASFQQLIDQGTPMTAIDIGAHYCREIDTADDLSAAENELLARQPAVAAAR